MSVPIDAKIAPHGLRRKPCPKRPASSIHIRPCTHRRGRGPSFASRRAEPGRATRGGRRGAGDKRRAIDSALEEVVGLTRLAEDLLTPARFDAGQFETQLDDLDLHECFRSVRELIAGIERFTDHYNPKARPFTWTATAESILGKMERLYQRDSGTQR
jgi:signal transduction histidine kinase